MFSSGLPENFAHLGSLSFLLCLDADPGVTGVFCSCGGLRRSGALSGRRSSGGSLFPPGCSLSGGSSLPRRGVLVSRAGGLRDRDLLGLFATGVAAVGETGLSEIGVEKCSTPTRSSTPSSAPL